MAALSKLQQTRDQLNSIDMLAHQTADSNLSYSLYDVLEQCKGLPLDKIDPVNSIIERKHQVIDEFTNELKSYIERAIVERYDDYYLQSNNWLINLDKLGYEQWIETKKKVYQSFNEEFLEYTGNRIKFNTNWQLPVLVWHLDQMGDLDNVFGFYPIFVADKWYESRYVIEDYTNHAQSRKIRFYDLDSSINLPSNCMGYILSKNRFTHATQEITFRELEWLEEKLLPGGVIAFNFNDCELAACTALFEQGIRSFQLGSKVKEKLLSLGLNITRWEFINGPNTVWVEATKAGKFTSRKRGETVGIIKSK